MRPLELTLSGFTSFTEEQHIGFGGLEVFAIGGPTGAGKSSILDAMLFALFGRVPRLGANEARSLISLERDRLHVLFDFAIRDRSYRVGRTIHRAKPAEAVLERIENGVRVAVLAEGVRNVDQRITELLGLGYEGFRRAVILPQGQFDALLCGSAPERRGVLKELLDFGTWETMRTAAKDRAIGLAAEIGLLEGRAAELGFATDAECERLDGALVTEKAGAVTADEELAAARAELAPLQRLAELTAELAEAEAERTAIEARAPGLEQERPRIAEAQRAAPVEARVASAEAAERRAAVAVKAKAEAEATHDRARMQEAASQVALTALGDVDEQVSLGDSRIAALRSVVPKRDERRRVDARRQQLDVRHREAAKQRAEGEARAATANTARGTAESELQAAEAALVTCAVWAERADLMARTVPLARAVVAAEVAHNSARVALGRAEAVAVERRAAVTLAARDEAEAVLLAEALTAAREGAERVAAVFARHAHVAALRADLTPGALCPVCEQSVADVPPPVPARDADAELRSAKAGERDALQCLQTVRAVRLTAEARLADAVVGQETAGQLAGAAAADLARQVLGLQQLTELGAAVVLAEEKELVAGLRAHEQAAARRAAAVGAQSAAVALQSYEAQRIVELDGRLEEGRAEGLALEAESRRLRDEIATVTTGDPAREIAAIERDNADARRQALELREAVASARERLAATESGLTSAAANDALRQSEAVGAATDALAAAIAAGFASVPLAAAAVMPAADLARRAAQIEAHDQTLRALEVLLLAAERVLAGRRVDRAEVRAAEEGLAERGRQRDAQIRALADLEAERRRVLSALAARRETDTRLAAAQGDEARYRRLMFLLQDNQFPAFLLESRFRELVHGASTRLLEWTGRFSLRFENDGFLVADHDLGETALRTADTLSGGETFLASLALALELSEQIQRLGGNVTLECLFIDEGFGTLDDEKLDAVAGALEALGGTGRLVGIVSHLPELNRRLPARMTVERTTSGSRVRIE